MKYAWMSLSCIVVMFALVSSVAAQPNGCEAVPPVDPCQGRVLCPLFICGVIPCGCHGQLVCDAFRPLCDPDHQPNGLICEYSKLSAEPTTNSTVIVTQNPDELFGWVNAHQHQFANLAYGGVTFSGSVFDERGVNAALARCDYSFDFPVRTPSLGLGVTLPVLQYFDWGNPIHGSLFSFAFNLPPFVPTQSFHGLMVNIATSASSKTPFAFHLSGGIGPFDGWPTYLNGGHQQMYYKWLERAYEGGLRLLVVHAVNNEVLCKISFQREGFGVCENSGLPCSTGGFGGECGGAACVLCNDMITAERQIDAIHALEAFIDDEQCGQPGSGCGWYRVATSSQQAREIISDGKMAVVIGIEVDSLFDCKPDVTFCDEGHISGQLDQLFNRGVRYVFPVHAFDNKFAGAALYLDIFAYANWLATGMAFDTWDCSSKGYKYKLEPLVDDPLLNVLYGPLAALLNLPNFDQNQVAHCNATGLTPEGEIFLNALIEKDMIIDIDHLSYRALEGFVNEFPGTHGFPPFDRGQNQCEDGSPCDPLVLDACQGIGDASCDVKGALEIFEDKNGVRGYAYPVMSGHSAIRKDFKVCSGNENACTTDVDCPAGQSCNLNVDNIGPEFTHTVSRVKRIRDLGGIVTLRAPGGKCGTTREFATGSDGIFGYNAIVAIMDGEAGEVPFYGEGHPGIAYTLDMGSFLPQTAPRFGVDAKDCPPDAPRLEYPFQAFDGSGEFFCQQTGDRIFDFNEDGLAHIGLMPDLLADVRTLSENGGVPKVDLDPLFNSAETFIRMWEFIDNCTPDTVPPTIDSLAVSPDRLWPPNHKMVGVTVDVSASDFCDPNPLCQITAVDSNEAQGKKSPDWVVTGDFAVNLRAERLGSGSGRVYTIEVTCSDYTDNTAMDTVDVFVPHDRRNRRN